MLRTRLQPLWIVLCLLLPDTAQSAKRPAPDVLALIGRAGFVTRSLPAQILAERFRPIDPCSNSGMKYCEVSRSALLNQLSTIFIFLFATVILKERLTLRRGLAIALAVAGAYLVIISA